MRKGIGLHNHPWTQTGLEFWIATTRGTKMNILHLCILYFSSVDSGGSNERMLSKTQTQGIELVANCVANDDLSDGTRENRRRMSSNRVHLLLLRPLARGDQMSDERGDRRSPDIHDRLPATRSRKPWVAPKVIVSAVSLTAGATKPPIEKLAPNMPAKAGGAS